MLWLKVWTWNTQSRSLGPVSTPFHWVALGKSSDSLTWFLPLEDRHSDIDLQELLGGLHELMAHRECSVCGLWLLSTNTGVWQQVGRGPTRDGTEEWGVSWVKGRG